MVMMWSSRVSLGVRIGYSSSCVRRPRVRIAGWAPADKWRSEARRATVSSSRSAKSKFMRWGLPRRSWSRSVCIGRSRRSRHSGHLGDGRQAELDLLQPVVPEAPHALLHGGSGDLIGRTALEDERADLLVDRHDL